MIKTIIIDDERNAREFLEKLLKKYFPNQFVICATCANVDDAFKQIEYYQPDLIFLDIQMPGKNGFELLSSIKTINFEIVFTTAYSEYAIKAIKHSAFDYLLKPINYIDLLSTVKRYNSQQIQLRKKQRVELLLNNINISSSNFDKITIPTEDGFTLISKNNILYAQASDNYCTIFLIDGSHIVASKTLKYIEELCYLPIFMRVHKSYLVNLNYVKHYHKVNFEIELISKTRIPVSHRKHSLFVKAITQNS